MLTCIVCLPQAQQHRPLLLYSGLHECSNLPTLPLTALQLVEDGWLANSPNRAGCYTLGVRSLLELGEYILSLDLPDATRGLLQNIL